MLQSYFQATFYDSDMSYLRRSPKRRSRSFVQGFLKLHYGWTANASITITDIDGASASSFNGSANARYYHTRATGCGRGGIALFNSSSVPQIVSADSGIVVGTGTTAVAPTDYQLATQVLDGTTSGTLEHFPSSGSTLTISNPTGSFTIERLFRNSSGSSITINEVGVYVSATNAGTMTSVCIIRDIVSPGFAVLNGEYMRIIYTLSVTV